MANREKLCKQEVVNLERAIKAAEIEEIREARLEIQRILVERGLRAEQILDGLPLKAVKAQRKPQAPSTVRHTGPEGQVWSGRGRAPNWFKRQQGALGGGQV